MWGVSRGTWLVLFVLVSILADIASMAPAHAERAKVVHDGWTFVSFVCLGLAIWSRSDY